MNESTSLVIETRGLSKSYKGTQALKSPIYTLVLKRDSARVQQSISSQPWIKSIQAMPANGHTTWQVAVADEVAAEAQLLRLVQSDGAVTVTEFGRKKADLEEVSLGLTEGGNHGKQ